MIFTESSIRLGWKREHSPVVSVVCITYNHERFIKNAVEGFLLQKTSFPFEIIVADDHSQDETRSIVCDYQRSYPSIIRLINNKKKMGPMKNFLCALKKATGRYIALCEGDDYWTDPNKLSAQIAFLESNSDYVLSGHDAQIMNENREVVKLSKTPASQKKDFEGDDLIKCNVWLPTMSWVFRNVLKEIPEEFAMVKNGDTFLISLLGHFGKSKFHHEIKPAVYLSHKGGFWSAENIHNKLDSQINTLFWIYRYYYRTGQEEYSKFFWQKYFRKVISCSSIGLVFRETFRKAVGAILELLKQRR